MEVQKVELPGVPNLWKVAEGLYRSGRPTAEGWDNLVKMGLKTVINLEYFHVDQHPPPIYVFNYPMVAWWPETEDVIRFLKTIKTAERPILWHCLQGSDRTGFMTAFYRIIMEGWTKDQAIEEMTLPQFGFHGVFETLLDNIEKCDIDRIKQEVSL